ncbi:S1 RNA-binding domain-containing protein [Nonomuraea indica]|uniref:S1 RNA-binding domain-containing protein n=1 Tax=Nonomuraea indica TaxID=1581193 RepID=UPI000C7D9977|nr:S1 RNA-binding domain-containing protein [Nonomuraea indica]
MSNGGSHASLDSLLDGQVVKAVVTSISRSGVFVDLGGIEGYISVPNLSWKQFDDPSDVVRVGQEVVAVVLQVDFEHRQVRLSMKALSVDPLQHFALTMLGTILTGPVVKVVPIGAFVKVDEDVVGLVPVSEFEEDHAGRMPDVGTEITVRVESINLNLRRVQLSLNPSLTSFHPRATS